MPDLIISFLDRWNIITLAASIGLGVPVLVQEHCDPNERALGGTWELLRYLLYPRASFVVTLTPTAMRFFSLRPKIRGRVIPNPVVVPPNEYVHPSSNIIGKDYRKIVSLGRLHEVKSFDKLLSAFAFIANKHPDWSLEIWGDGPERPQLTSLIVEMNLEGRVSLPGVTRNPFACLTGADLFVMTSKTEGFPMALCEAMACGVPVISFDCPSGPRHIVRDGVDGVLVPPGDINALAIAMDRLMSDEAERCRLANRAPDVLERFSLEKVVGMWEELIRQADEYR
jgi:glycosyltransferase involved in cell wall biosynthesis